MGDTESARGGVISYVILDCIKENLPTICQPGSIYAQDNASTHTAHIVKDWLSNWAEENGITVVEWPPYSPDLNPIENLWKLLKAAIIKQYPALATLPKSATSLMALVRAAIGCWEELKEELLQKLVESMDRRMEAVILANGWYTTY